MRSLTNNLAIAQVAESNSPFVYVRVGSYSYMSSSRVLYVDQQEKPYGGLAKIILDNSDRSLDGIDFRGLETKIGWGFLCSQAEWVDAPPMWVYDYSETSFAGKLAIEINLIDIWNKLSLNRVLGGGTDLTGTIVGVFQPGMWVVGQSSGVKARVLFATNTYISVTNISENSGYTNFLSGESVASLDYPQAISISGVTVTNWGGGSSPGWAGGPTSDTILQMLQQIIDLVPVVLDTDDGIIQSLHPAYHADVNTTVLQITQDLLNRTKSAMRMGADGRLHVFSVATDPAPSNYYTDGSHVTFSNIRSKKLVIPNRFFVLYAAAGSTGTQAYWGVAESAPDHAQYGSYVTEVVEAEVSSSEEANSMAASMVRRTQMESSTGQIVAPMHIGQELFDFVQCTDNRSGATFTGWVGSIEREFKANSGYYRITIGLGGLQQAFNLDQSSSFPLPNLPISSIPKISYQPPTPAKQPTPGSGWPTVDIVFRPISKDRVDWDPGFLRYPDGKVYAITGGSRTMLDPIEYGYVELGVWQQAYSIQFSNTLSNVQNQTRSMVVEFVRGVVDSDRVLVIPVKGRCYWNLDNLFDGVGYGRTKKYALDADGLVFLDAIRDTSNFGKVKKSALDANGLIVLDNTVDGTYAKIKRANLTADGLVVLAETFEVKNGSVGLVAATNITAGSIILSKTVQDSNARYINETYLNGGAVRAFNFFEGSYTAEGVKLTNARAGSSARVDLNTDGLFMYRDGSERFSIRNDIGRATAGPVQLDASGLWVGGTVGIHSDGVHIYGQKLIFHNSDGSDGGWVYLENGTVSILASRGVNIQGDLNLAWGARFGSGDVWWSCQNGDRVFGPEWDRYGKLGDENHHWYQVHAINIYCDNISANHGIFGPINPYHHLDDVAEVIKMHDGLKTNNQRVNFNRAIGLLVGAVHQLNDRVSSLEQSNV